MNLWILFEIVPILMEKFSINRVWIILDLMEYKNEDYNHYNTHPYPYIYSHFKLLKHLRLKQN